MGSVGEETVVFRAVATLLPHPATNLSHLLSGHPHLLKKEKKSRICNAQKYVNMLKTLADYVELLLKYSKNGLMKKNKIKKTKNFNDMDLQS